MPSAVENGLSPGGQPPAVTLPRTWRLGDAHSVQQFAKDALPDRSHVAANGSAPTVGEHHLPLLEPHRVHEPRAPSAHPGQDALGDPPTHCLHRDAELTSDVGGGSSPLEIHHGLRRRVAASGYRRGEDAPARTDRRVSGCVPLHGEPQPEFVDVEAPAACDAVGRDLRWATSFVVSSRSAMPHDPASSGPPVEPPLRSRRDNGTFGERRHGRGRPAARGVPRPVTVSMLLRYDQMVAAVERNATHKLTAWLQETGAG